MDLFSITEASARAEALDGQIMDRRVVSALRRERDRALAKVEVLELEVKQLQMELDAVCGHLKVCR